jgi:hypothetical protein
MPRHDRAYGTWSQSGRKAGSVARKNRNKSGGKYALKIGKDLGFGKKRKRGKRLMNG